MFETSRPFKNIEASQKVDAKIAYINDVPFTLIPGETILQFVRRNLGENLVPTLCDAPNLDPFGSCRICSVDVALVQNGNAKAMASCHTLSLIHI